MIYIMICARCAVLCTYCSFFVAFPSTMFLNAARKRTPPSASHTTKRSNGTTYAINGSTMPSSLEHPGDSLGGSG